MELKTGSNTSKGLVKPDRFEKDVWCINPDIVDPCPSISPIPTIIILETTYKKVMYLMGQFPGCEWLAYLRAKHETPPAGAKVVLVDLLIPEQTVSAAHVTVLKGAEMTPDIVGTIHSHNTMGSFFSYTDHEYLEGNHNLNIVISDRGGMLCSYRRIPPCGKPIIDKVAISMRSEPGEEPNMDTLPIERIQKTRFPLRVWNIGNHKKYKGGSYAQKDANEIEDWYRECYGW